MASKCFTHSGTVLSVDSGSLRVGFTTQGACGGCSARSKCGMVDSSTREVVVKTSKSESYSVGDSVNIAISYNMGVMSVVIAYIIPLVILVAALVASVSIGLSEGVAALISLLTVAIYFVVVYLMRGKVDKQIKFTIENK